MPLVRRRCLACRHEYDVIEQHGLAWAIEHPVLASDEPIEAKEERLLAGELLACPACLSQEMEPVITSGIGHALGGAAGAGRLYPYFDRALNRWIESKTQHERVCRELGLIQDGDALDHMLAEHSRRRREEEEFDRQLRQQQAELDADPDIRRTRDVLATLQRDPDVTRRRENVGKFLRGGGA